MWALICDYSSHPISWAKNIRLQYLQVFIVIENGYRGCCGISDELYIGNRNKYRCSQKCTKNPKQMKAKLKMSKLLWISWVASVLYLVTMLLHLWGISLRYYFLIESTSTTSFPWQYFLPFRDVCLYDAAL